MKTALSEVERERITRLVDSWVHRGLVPPTGADRILDDLLQLTEAPEPGGSRVSDRAGSLVVEALAYVGGVVVLTGTILVGVRYWGPLGAGGRLAAVVTAAVVLLAAGLVVPARRGGAAARLRAVVWLCSTAAVAGSLALFASDVLELPGPDQFVLVSLGTATYAGALWLHTPSPLQQVAMMTASALAAAALLNRAAPDSDLPGVGIWAVCLVWGLLGWRGILEPSRMAIALGTAGAIFGSMLTNGSDPGIALSLVTVAAAVTCAVLLRDLVVLGVAAVGALFTLPVALQRWFPDSVAGALALVATGLTLVGTAAWIARRRKL